MFEIEIRLGKRPPEIFSMKVCNSHAANFVERVGFSAITISARG
jgi:hypothetical protein